MRRIGILAAFALVLAVPAGATGIGIGVFGGASIPVANDLSDRGSIYGVRVPVHFSPGLSAEAFYTQSTLGDVTEDFGGGVTGTRDGGDMKSLGANLVFGMGAPALSFHTILGIGSYKLERESVADIKKTGYTLGLGLGIAPPGLMGLSFDVRGEFVMIPTDQTSQKFSNVTAGVSYNFFSTP